MFDLCQGKMAGAETNEGREGNTRKAGRDFL